MNTSSIATVNLDIQQGSPAINAGDPTFMEASGETDYNGDDRVQQGRVDIGADETNYPTASPSKLEMVNDWQVVTNKLAGTIEVIGFNQPLTNVQLFDLNGRLVRQGREVLEVSDLPAGVYVLVVNGRDSKKIVW